MTISNSTLSGNSAEFGGGIWSNDPLDISNSTLSGNTATTGDGGGIWSNDPLDISNSTFSGNTATTGDGGGIWNNDPLDISNSTFSDNSATDGGGIFNLNGNINTIDNSTFSGNTASFHGGGIYNDNSISTISNSTFSGNTASFHGGGIYNKLNSNITTIDNSTFSDNTATSNGGGILNNGTITTITNSTFSDNTATSEGGGIDNWGTITDISNSTFSGNSANFGGGIVNFSLITTIANSTFSDNSANTLGGGIHNTFGTITNLVNTIIANSPSGGNCDGVPTGTKNLSDDGTCSFTGGGGSDNDTSINLDSLADNGGATQTHALLTGSSAIDTGANNVCANSPVNNLDQRGAVRPVNVTCDIGAYEYNGALADVSFTVDVTKIYEDASDGSTTATVTVTLANYQSDVDVYFSFSGAASPPDYTVDWAPSANTYLTFTGNGTQTFDITAFDDTLTENPESLNLTMTVVGAAQRIGTNPQTITIISKKNRSSSDDESEDVVSSPDISVFDPAISKIGVLQPDLGGAYG